MRNFSSDFKKLVRSLLIVSAIIIGASVVSVAQEAAEEPATAGGAEAVVGDAAAGEALFKANCTSCHAVDKRVMGPALAGVDQRHDKVWLHKWIKNAPAMVAAGDAAAVKIFNEYNQAPMTPFPQLSDADIDNILAFVKAEEAKKAEKPAAGGAAEAAVDTGVSGLMIAGLVAVIAIALIVILVLNRVISTLERLLLNKGEALLLDEEEEEAEAKDRYAGVRKFLKNKKAVFFSVIVLLVVVGAYSTSVMWNTGIQQGYQPVQPIKFSHQLHAGTNQIECQYCHTGAWKSKNASIPSLNVCMNCHKYVQATDKYDGEISPEIKKIYAALDYDPETQKYGENPRPIEWVRIHNLPDLAYFNHSQHVNVAGIECQKCHGPIETMEEVYQYSPLTMKWCINCHRETEVNHKDNAFYDKVIAAHEQIKKGEKITAAVLGGLECGKCHY
ncbi:cytochrome c3 family protein [Pseudopedobacter beijingensis]|uniref:Cytochrome c3 family protein n=1 Tax=Pseudopedobacter beijingensis TaxID=1207056 RepID=A0ABW4I7N0_9SPHI